MTTDQVRALEVMLDRIAAKLHTMENALYEGRIGFLKSSEALSYEELDQFSAAFVREFQHITGSTPKEKFNWSYMDPFIEKQRTQAGTVYDNIYHLALVWVEGTRGAIAYMAGYTLSTTESSSEHQKDSPSLTIIQNIFTDNSQQVNQSGGVSQHSNGDINTGGDVVGRDKISNV